MTDKIALKDVFPNCKHKKELKSYTNAELIPKTEFLTAMKKTLDKHATHARPKHEKSSHHGKH
jgi:hypothetical protein